MLFKKSRAKNWEKVDFSIYSQAYHQYGGSVATHPDVLKTIEELTGIKTVYYAQYKNDNLMGAIATWDQYLAGGRRAMKVLGIENVIDLGVPELILPLNASENFDIDFKAQGLSSLHQHQINSGLLSRSPYSLGMLRTGVFGALSSRSKRELRRQYRRIQEDGGYVKSVASLTSEEFKDIYCTLFSGKWSYPPRGYKSMDVVFSKLSQFLFGYIFYFANKPAAVHINYLIVNERCVSVEFINAAIDAKAHKYSLGSIVNHLNTQEAERIAEEAKKPLRFSFGRMLDEKGHVIDQYKERWCVPSTVYST